MGNSTKRQAQFFFKKINYSRILSIDPSTRHLGWAFAENGRLTEANVISKRYYTTKKYPVKEINQEYADRFVKQIIIKHQPTHIIIEEYNMQTSYSIFRGTEAVIMMKGILHYILGRLKINHEFIIKTLPMKFLGTMSGRRYVAVGKELKKITVDAVNELLIIDDIQLDRDIPKNWDIADAIAQLLYFLDLNQSQINELKYGGDNHEQL